MKIRNIIYSLRNVNNQVVLSIDLTAKILSEDTAYIIIDLPTGISHIRKADYLNKMKIYQVDEKLFFLICDKKVDRKFIFDALMKHAIDKIESRVNLIENEMESLDRRKNVLQTLKQNYQKVIAA